MKKLKTKEQEKKEQQRKQLTIGLVMISIMVFSSLGFAIMNVEEGQENKITEYQTTFYRQQGLWIFEKDAQTYSTQHLPSELENYTTTGTFTITPYLNKPLYLVGNAGNAEPELINNLGRYAQRYQKACHNEEECEGNLPIKNCSTDAIIIYKEGNNTEITQKENCAIITGDYLKGTDLLIYKTLNIL